MAEKDEIFYKPHIPAPERKSEPTPDEVIQDRAYRTEVAQKLNIPEEDIPDPYTAFEKRFEEYNTIALLIKKRASFLLDKTIEDLDLYVGDAPLHILKLITDLTDIHFNKPDGTPLPKTDPAYTLPAKVAQCIFRVAGAYKPRSEEEPYLDAVKDFDSDALKQTVTNKLQNSSYLQQIFYGLQLLILILKMAHVIATHYTIGWICGFFKGKLDLGWKFKVPSPINKEFGFSFGVGDMIAKHLHMVEQAALKAVGYSCTTKNKDPEPCDNESWRKVDFKQTNCCSNEPIFFGENSDSVSSFLQSSCFEKWIRQEMDPDYTGARTICSINNAQNEQSEPNEYERVAAQEVARYLETRPSATGTMGNGAENVKALSRSIEAADAGIVMTDTVASSIKNNRKYTYTGKSSSPWDCFGMQDEDKRTPEERMAAAVNNAAGQFLPKSNGQPLIGNSHFTFLEQLDTVIGEILTFADKVVSCIANLAKWGSSKELCCFVYLIVAIASIWRALITKGQWCPDMEDGEAVRNELHLHWAKDIRNNTDVEEFVTLLQVIKQIVDIFINKMNRQIMLAGLSLPLGEMWELIKVTLANGLSEFLDIIFGPLDKILAGFQTIPEIRHMVNNECFGFDKFLSFLLCLLGNLKWGIINSIMKILDFTLPDIVLLNDILLSRMRLKSLEGLSALLANLINLLLNLRDCYDPEDIINQVIKKEVQNEYNSMQHIVTLAGSKENLAKFDEYSKPLIAESNSFNSDEQAAIDALQAGIASQFGDFGPAAKEIVDNAINAPSLSVTDFINKETGEMISLGEFTILMEEMTGTSINDITMSLRSIYDILCGNTSQ